MANINVKDSSLMSRSEFLAALDAMEHTPEYEEVVGHRSRKSLIREWAAHKLCYRLGLWKARMLSVDLNWPQKWYVSLCYWSIGGIASWFYK